MATDTEQFDPIPETVAEALAKWDAGETVFTVEMGGLGPGYEQAIQRLAFELMREWHTKEWPALSADMTPELRQAREDEADAIVARLNGEPWARFSGAQVGAAKSLAAIVCRRGYRAALRDEMVGDRLIQTEKIIKQ